MTDSYDLLRRLRIALADCCPDREQAALLARDAGLSPRTLDLTGTPEGFWQHILDEAARQGRVGALLRLAVAGAPADDALADLSAEYARQTATRPERPAAPAAPRSEQTNIRDQLQRAVETGDTGRIKAVVDAHRYLLNGVPQYIAGTPIIADLLDFPVAEGLVPDFTRFIFQPHASQIPNSILLVDLLSPGDSVFQEGLAWSPEVSQGATVIRSYIDFIKHNYEAYCRRAVRQAGFSIPLSTLLGLGGFLEVGGVPRGVLVVGRRKYLTAGQLHFLAENNRLASNDWETGISIVTYDALIEQARSAAGQRYTQG